MSSYALLIRGVELLNLPNNMSDQGTQASSVIISVFIVITLFIDVGC